MKTALTLLAVVSTPASATVYLECKTVTWERHNYTVVLDLNEQEGVVKMGMNGGAPRSYSAVFKPDEVTWAVPWAFGEMMSVDRSTLRITSSRGPDQTDVGEGVCVMPTAKPDRKF